MAQRYKGALTLSFMEAGNCPECGESPEVHLDDNRFWLPRRCDLLPHGVRDRIAQYQQDKENREEEK